MTSRFVRPCLASLMFAAAASTHAQPPQGQPTPLPQRPAGAPAAQPPAEEQMVEVNLPDADLDTILKALEIYTGKINLRPAALPTTTYNIRTPRVPKSAAIRYLETVLAMNGISIVPLDANANKIVAVTVARNEAPELITGSALDLAPSGKVASKLFTLEFARVTEVQPLLQVILNMNYGGPTPLANVNAFLVTDSITNLQRAEILLQQVDRPVTSGMRPRFFQLKNGAKASDVVAKMRTILTGTLQTQLGMATTYSADDRTNQIILVTDARQEEFFAQLIDKLDQRADPNTRNDVIPLNHAKALDVVNVLKSIIQGQSTAVQRAGSQSTRPGQGLQPNQPGMQVQPGQAPIAAPQPQVVAASSALNAAVDALGASTNEFSTILTVVNDDRTNSIVVSGTADDIRLLRDLVKKLDIVLAQVRIEVVIAEVTLEDNDQTGIGALGLKVEGDKLTGFALNNGDSNPLGFAVTNGTINRTAGWDLAAEIAISTTPRKSNNIILSHPSISTSHGKPGIIFNGETRPVVTGNTALGGNNSGVTSSITQQQIGTNLTVTPFIGVDGSVQLDIKQTVEDVTGTVTIDGNPNYIIGRRESTSYITAKSGEVIVLGGFQKNTEIRSTSRLGPIPILGDIFGARQKQKRRQELIFFLRPIVLTNNAATDNADALKRVETMPNKDEVKNALNPEHPIPKRSILDKILPK